MNTLENSKHATVPVLRRLWLVNLGVLAILTFPLVLLILASGPVYRWREGGWTPISNTSRLIYAGALGVWLLAVIGNAVLSPTTLKEEWARSAGTAKPANQANQAEADTSPPPGGGVKADDYQIEPDESSAPAKQAATAPADQQQYFAQLRAIRSKAAEAGEGTRTYDEAMQELDDLGASKEGTTLENWVCTIPPNDGGDLRISRSISCWGNERRESQMTVVFDNSGIITETMYSGDIIRFSGTVENHGRGDLRVLANAGAIIQKSK